MFSEVQSLSWQLFETFVIKENHGFNKSTLAIFRADKIKLLLINLILGIPIYTGIMGAIEWGGEMFYLYLLGFTMFTLIILMNLIPNVIMPMFNDYKELEVGDLRTAIENLARSLDFPLKKLFVMDASKRTAHSNAFYFGFGNNKRIVLFDTLLNQHKGPEGIQEILGIVKHELGHWHYMHPF